MGWKDAPIVSGWQSAPVVGASNEEKAQFVRDELMRPVRAVRDVAAGAVRGAGSIGATLRAPFDFAEQGLERLMGAPARAQSINAQRRQEMTGALQSMGADTESIPFAVGKIGAEIAGTAGIGGAAANALSRTSLSPALVQAIRTSGMSGGNIATRAAGGAAVGGLSAGLVDPEQAGTGALIGGAFPGAVQVAGAAGKRIGGVIAGPPQSADMAQAVQKARQAGYVIPPTQANPTLGNRLLEGFSGKITTAQNASAKNQEVTNRLVNETLGLAPEVKITPEVLKGIRDEAGAAYQRIKAIGTMTGDAQFNRQLSALKGAYEGAAKDFPELANPELSRILDSLKQPTFKASSAVDAIRILRDKADAAFTKGEKATAKALRAAAGNMEDLIERNLLRINAERSLTSIMRQGGGADDIVSAGLSNPASQLLDDFRNARQMIAKTYTAEKALNPASGSIDAKKLAAELKKGKPLSGGMRQAGEFASQFPKASQALEGMGSLPQMSPLDFSLGAILSGATANPLMLASVAARPTARAMVLSPMVQNRLIQSQGNALMRLADPDLMQFGYRAAPVALSDR